MKNNEKSTENAAKTGVSQKLLNILVCPLCKAKLKSQSQEGKNFLVCNSCKLKFPIEDGIPQLLENQAEKL